jgi:hypothetical protein
MMHKSTETLLDELLAQVSRKQLIESAWLVDKLLDIRVQLVLSNQVDQAFKEAGL